MSTPRTGWIARDSDGALFRYDNQPQPMCTPNGIEWYGGDGEWTMLDRTDYPDLKPGECREIINAQQMGRAGAAFEDEAHRKTLAELDALRARLEEAERLLGIAKRYAPDTAFEDEIERWLEDTK